MKASPGRRGKTRWWEWHVQTLARVRAESWIPGMAGEVRTRMVERALSRFSSYHMRTTIAVCARRTPLFSASSSMP